MAKQSAKRTDSRGIVQLRKYLTRLEFKYSQEADGTLQGVTAGNNVQWNWLARALDEGEVLRFTAYSPVYAGEDLRPAVAEYITRANWGMWFGNFDMDWSDGQVGFRTSIPVAPSGVTDAALGRLVYSNCMVMERYLPGLLAVSLGGTGPEQALRDVERTVGEKAPAEPDAPEPASATQDPAAQPSNGHPPLQGRFFATEN